MSSCFRCGHSLSKHDETGCNERVSDAAGDMDYCPCKRVVTHKRLGPIPPVDPELDAMLKGLTGAATPEPPPTGDGEVVLDAVLKKIDERGMGFAHLFPLQARVRADLIARAEFGHKKYGTYLRTHNGRNVTLDLYQEMLDGIMYAMQARMEGNHVGTLVENLMVLAQIIAKELAAQERNEHR